MGEEDAVRNSPSLDTPILYAHDLGSKNQELEKFFPQYTFYRGSYDREKKKPKIEKI